MSEWTRQEEKDEEVEGGGRTQALVQHRGQRGGGERGQKRERGERGCAREGDGSEREEDKSEKENALSRNAWERRRERVDKGQHAGRK